MKQTENQHKGENFRKKLKTFWKRVDKPEGLCYNIQAKWIGSLVKRLRHGPLKAETGVRFSHESPSTRTLNLSALFLCLVTRGRTNSAAIRTSAISKTEQSIFTSFCLEKESSCGGVRICSSEHIRRKRGNTKKSAVKRNGFLKASAR